ncbi:hypothetical protein [Paenibacillus sp. TH7-28]
MAMDQLEQRWREELVTLVYEHLEIPRCTNPSDVNQDTIETWGSSRHLSLIMEIESAFGISFRIEEVMNARSFDDLAYLLSCKI